MRKTCRSIVALLDLRTILILCLLLLPVIAVYWPVGGHPFITLDDEEYVTRNPSVLQGVTAEKFRWAFTTFYATHWHPVTWLSHMADVELFGLDPGWHHRVNLLFHLANAWMVYWVLQGMTGAVWRSAFVAMLFGLHPLHVESVAWIAERKDVLCAFWWLLSTWAYSAYARRGGGTRYIAVTVFLLLGLMSKPMIVTLPFVFLLLDYWPLRRIGPHEPEGEIPSLGGRRRSPGELFKEKTPWFFLSLASCAVTYVAQREGGAMDVSWDISLPQRIGNAAVSYLRYIGKFAWPEPLAIFYPHPAHQSGGLPGWQVAAAVAALTAVTLASVRCRRSRPWLLAGWLFFLGTLVPVIGLVQVGKQGMADRYMYLPLIGLAVIVSWGMEELTRDLPRRGRILGAGAGALMIVLSVATHLQVSRWKDSVTLFRHTLSVTSENWTACFNLADALLSGGDADQAIQYFEKGLRYRPGDLDAQLNLGRALGEKGRYAEASIRFREVLRSRPGDPLALLNLGVALNRLGRNEEALACMRSAAVHKPDFIDAYTNLGAVLLQLGRRDEAIVHLRHALTLNPRDPAGRRLMGAATGMPVE